MNHQQVGLPTQEISRSCGQKVKEIQESRWCPIQCLTTLTWSSDTSTSYLWAKKVTDISYIPIYSYTSDSFLKAKLGILLPRGHGSWGHRWGSCLPKGGSLRRNRWLQQHLFSNQSYCLAQVTKGSSASVVQHQSMQSQSIRVGVQAICKIFLRVALPTILVDLLSPSKRDFGLILCQTIAETIASFPQHRLDVCWATSPFSFNIIQPVFSAPCVFLLVYTQTSITSIIEANSCLLVLRQKIWYPLVSLNLLVPHKN